MSNKTLPLEEYSIGDLFFSTDRYVYEVPIYQRNYAWGMDEIRALVQDCMATSSSRVLAYLPIVRAKGRLRPADPLYRRLRLTQRKRGRARLSPAPPRA